MRTVLVPVFLVALLVAPHAAAETEHPADSLLREGVALRKQGREREALARFSRAFGLDPSPRAAAQMGLAERALADWVDAERHLTLALGTSDPWVERHRDALEFALTSVQKRLGWLHVEVDTPGLELLLPNDVSVPLPLEEPVRVAAGRVRYKIAMGERTVLEHEITVSAGAVARERPRVGDLPDARPEGPLGPEAPRPRGASDLEEASSAPHDARPETSVEPPSRTSLGSPSSPPLHATALSAKEREAERRHRRAQQETLCAFFGGAGIAVLGTSAALGAVALSSRGQLSARCTERGDCTSPSDERLEATAQDFGQAALVSGAIGAAALGVAAILFVDLFQDGSSRAAAVVATPTGFRVHF